MYISCIFQVYIIYISEIPKEYLNYTSGISTVNIKHILKNRIISIVLGLFYPLNEPKTKSVVQSAKYRVIGLKICMQAHFMVVQALLE